MIDLKLKDSFIELIFAEYEVTGNLANYLYERWKIQNKFQTRGEIEQFIKSNKVKNVFYPVPDVNIAKEYTESDLSSFGIKLSILDKDKRIYEDDKYNFKWQEQYNGFVDSYTGYFKVIEPEPNDSSLC